METKSNVLVNVQIHFRIEALLLSLLELNVKKNCPNLSKNLNKKKCCNILLFCDINIVIKLD